jgi:hypothetical protein
MNLSLMVASTVGPEQLKLMLARPELSPNIFRMHLAGMLAAGAPGTALLLVVAGLRRAAVAADIATAYSIAATTNICIFMACNTHSMVVYAPV